MSGTSRLAYHAVPRVLPSPNHGVPLPQCLRMCECLEVHRDEACDSEQQFEQKCTCSGNKRNVNGSKVEKDAKFESMCFCQKNLDHKICKCESGSEFAPYFDYLRTSRINMNVRQVLAPGQTFKMTSKAGIVDNTIETFAEGSQNQEKKQKPEGIK